MDFKRLNNTLKNDNDELKRQIEKLENDLRESKKPKNVAPRISEIDLSAISRSFGLNAAINGFGHFSGLDSASVRRGHDENAVKRVLRAIAAGFTELNLKELDKIVF